jgi:hypothetical protein
MITTFLNGRVSPPAMMRSTFNNHPSLIVLAKRSISYRINKATPGHVEINIGLDSSSTLPNGFAISERTHSPSGGRSAAADGDASAFWD